MNPSSQWADESCDEGAVYGADPDARPTPPGGAFDRKYPRVEPNELRFIDSERGVQNMSEQVPTIGRIVHYKLTADDAAQINRRRTTGKSIAARLLWGSAGRHSEAVPAHSEDGRVRAWPAGAQAHIGNEAKEGDVFPMMITRVWGDNPSSAVNGQAYLDGTDVLWVTSACVGEGPRTFSWPTRT